MARYRESGVPRPQRWMALVGAGCAHGSPSLPLNHTVGHASGRRPAATAPGVSKKTNLHTTHCMGSITETGRGDAHVTGQNTPSVGVCDVSLCVCLWGGSQRVGQM